MGHTAVRRAALTSFAVNLFCLMVLILAVSVLRPPETAPVSSEHLLADVGKTEENQPLQLPMQIPCTSLTVESMAIFDGGFYEDGSGSYVADVAALIVYNNSDSVIPYAEILVDTEQGQLTFRAHMLLPRSYTLVPEFSAQQYESCNITNIYAWHTVAKEEDRAPIYITEQDDVTLRIENGSEKDLMNLTVYFKKFVDGVYIGGKPFEFTVSSLPAGESVVVSPQYYVSGYSRIIYHKENTLQVTDPEGIMRYKTLDKKSCKRGFWG